MKNMVFHIESENLSQVILELDQAKIKYIRINEFLSAQTPYQNIYKGMDIEIGEQEVPDFLRTIQKLSVKNKIVLYRKEKWQGKINSCFYYRPYPFEELPFYLKTTFLYQKLRRAEEFLPDFSNATGNVNLSFLENMQVTLQEENHLRGAYESISHPLNSAKIIAEDLGNFEMQAIQEEDAYKVLTQIENHRKQLQSQKTINDYLFEIPAKNGISAYKMLEYYIPYDEETIIHYGLETKRRELYLKKDGAMDLVPYYKYDCTESLNETEKIVEETIENYKRSRALK